MSKEDYLLRLSILEQEARKLQENMQVVSQQIMELEILKTRFSYKSSERKMKEDSGNEKKPGKVIGFIVMYFIFTSILYFALQLLKKLPGNWNYMHVVLI